MAVNKHLSRRRGNRWTRNRYKSTFIAIPNYWHGLARCGIQSDSINGFDAIGFYLRTFVRSKPLASIALDLLGVRTVVGGIEWAG